MLVAQVPLADLLSALVSEAEAHAAAAGRDRHGQAGGHYRVIRIHAGIIEAYIWRIVTITGLIDHSGALAGIGAGVGVVVGQVLSLELLTATVALRHALRVVQLGGHGERDRAEPDREAGRVVAQDLAVVAAVQPVGAPGAVLLGVVDGPRTARNLPGDRPVKSAVGVAKRDPSERAFDVDLDVGLGLVALAWLVFDGGPRAESASLVKIDGRAERDSLVRDARHREGHVDVRVELRLDLVVVVVNAGVGCRLGALAALHAHLGEARQRHALRERRARQGQGGRGEQHGRLPPDFHSGYRGARPPRRGRNNGLKSAPWVKGPDRTGKRTTARVTAVSPRQPRAAAGPRCQSPVRRRPCPPAVFRLSSRPTATSSRPSFVPPRLRDASLWGAA